MNVTVEMVNDVVVIDVPNESIDVSNAPDFKRDLTNAFEDNANVVMDLANVNFVDSAGLGTMVWAVKQLAARGGDMRLCNVNGAVRSLFELVRMHKLVSVFDTREDAIASF